jgi:hypothetical protein
MGGQIIVRSRIHVFYWTGERRGGSHDDAAGRTYK